MNEQLHKDNRLPRTHSCLQKYVNLPILQSLFGPYMQLMNSITKDTLPRKNLHKTKKKSNNNNLY